MLPNEQKSKAA